jgi:hypothetical protein
MDSLAHPRQERQTSQSLTAPTLQIDQQQRRPDWWRAVHPRLRLAFQLRVSGHRLAHCRPCNVVSLAPNSHYFGVVGVVGVGWGGVGWGGVGWGGVGVGVGWGGISIVGNTTQ